MIFFLIFALIIDYGYTLEPPWRGYPESIGIPLHTPALLYKSGV